MTPSRTDLPPSLAHRSFTVSEALRAGATRGVLRHARHAAPYSGSRSTRAPLDAKATRRDRAHRAAQDFLPLLRPGEAFSHTTALLILGCPIHCSPSLHVSTPLPATPHRRTNMRGHSSQPFLPGAGVDELPLVPAPLAFVQSAGMLPFAELVVAADHLLLPRHRFSDGSPLTDSVELSTCVARSSARGVRRARAALSFARSGSESRMETLLRLLMAQHGLDVLDLQIDLHDADGVWIGRFDMVDPVRKLIIEYDGEQHRTDRAQYLKDQYRLDRARAAGYRILRLHHEDVLGRPLQTARRIAEFLGVPLNPVAPATMRPYLAR